MLERGVVHALRRLLWALTRRRLTPLPNRRSGIRLRRRPASLSHPVHRDPTPARPRGRYLGPAAVSGTLTQRVNDHVNVKPGTRTGGVGGLPTLRAISEVSRVGV